MFDLQSYQEALLCLMRIERDSKLRRRMHNKEIVTEGLRRLRFVSWGVFAVLHCVRMTVLVRMFRDFFKEFTFKDFPPPYSENDVPQQEGLAEDHNITVNTLPCEALDLLANCKITSVTDDSDKSEVEYAEIPDMGLWHSTPLAHRHKSKISLTWVLKENLESAKLPPEKSQVIENKFKSRIGKEVERHYQKFNEVDNGQRKCKSSREVRERVVGRNEYYHNWRFKNACKEFVNDQDSGSDTSVGTEYTKRKHHRHKHRRRKRNNSRFGYDIRDLDSFLSEATIDRPGNIPVVVAYPTSLYKTHKETQQEQTLPLGTVVNAVFKNQQWLYAQTPHGDEGYVLYNACLPLGILPNRTSPQKKTPCWESSTDIYPRPCGNLTDTEKEQLRGRTRSECRYRPAKRNPKNGNLACAEKDFDTLYLKTKSFCSEIDKIGKENVNVNAAVKPKLKRQTLLVVNNNYKGSVLNKTLTVNQGDVVVLVQGKGAEADVDAEWFYVRKSDGTHGFIPAAIAGHGYI